MKKLLIAAMMFAVSATTFAQNPKIDKEVKAAGSYEAGLQVLNAQLAGLTAEQKAKGYNQLVEFLMPDIAKAQEAAQAGAPLPTGFYESLYKAVDAAVKCDPFDNEPNDKGKVAPKFHKKNQDRLKDLRVQLIVHGQNLMNAENPEGTDYLAAYVNSCTSSLFNEVSGENDPNRGNVARVVAFLYAQKESYPEAKKYAEIAMADEKSKEDTENIYLAILNKMMKTKQDTLNYINTLKEVNADKYFGQMASLYDRIGEHEMSKKLIEDEIARNPQNKMAWAIKGENAMNAREWLPAIEAFKKTTEIDPAFTAVWFNLGVCSYSYAADLQEKLADKQGRLTKENNEKVNEQIKAAKVYYEKVRELDPDANEVTGWPRQLRMVYNALGETDKAKEISKMLGEDD